MAVKSEIAGEDELNVFTNYGLKRKKQLFSCLFGLIYWFNYFLLKSKSVILVVAVILCAAPNQPKTLIFELP